VTTAHARNSELGPAAVPLHTIANIGRLLDVGLPDLRRIALDVRSAGIPAADLPVAVDRLVDVRGETPSAGGCQINLDPARSAVMLGAGKASVALVGAVESKLGRQVTGPLVVRPKGADGDLGRVDIVDADYPVPSVASLDAGRRLMTTAAQIAGGAGGRP
jgi:glycerate-2-kinase